MVMTPINLNIYFFVEGGPSGTKRLPTPALEIEVALLALRTFTASAYECFLQIHMENRVAIQYSNKCGGTKSPALASIASEIVA